MSFAWDPSPDATIAGYYLYYGAASRDYSDKIDLGNATIATVTNLNEGETYYFAISSYNEMGTESLLSDEISYTVPGGLSVVWGQNPEDPIRIYFLVNASHWYELQVTSDLLNWLTIWQSPVVEQDMPMELEDFSKPDSACRFYRLLEHDNAPNPAPADDKTSLADPVTQ